ncbi:hypothetical protein DICVIV_10231 [Dictyocaulus viviparus]|uniref:Peptidase M14 domain-containing protein n=1 Tax=Dictyocaulus viviparus TaxID=29172 RepID=A0A0D8XGM8_DICVI|nr:hypothetical protein DICVIV_10231 [Dictyocaulus viviparus]
MGGFAETLVANDQETGRFQSLIGKVASFKLIECHVTVVTFINKSQRMEVVRFGYSAYCHDRLRSVSIPRLHMRRLLAVLFIIKLAATDSRTPFFDLTRYHDFPEFEDYLRKVAVMNPDIVKLRVIGESRERRPLLGLKIGRSTNHTKPAVWLDGGNHAREWPAFHVAVYFIEELIRNYKVDDRITKYVDLLDIYIFPVLNPDGFIFSRTSKRSLILIV